MSITKMTTGNATVTVSRRASAVVFNTPRPEEGIQPSVRFVEENVISDVEGTRHSDAGTFLLEDIDVTDATTFTLYDTSGLSADSDVQFSGGLPTLPTNGTFTQRDMADMLLSYYVHLSHIRATVKEGSGSINSGEYECYSTVVGTATKS